jgi:tRNA pseudouridine38-40 synthase
MSMAKELDKAQAALAQAREVLAALDRYAAAPTFPAEGLYFVGPYYDAVHGIAEHTPAMDWLP